jgi:hypothetical protein
VELGQAEAERLRDRLAEIEAEQASLGAELAIFHAEYVRRVLTVLAQAQELDARILARTGDTAAAREAHSRARRSTSDVRAVHASPPPPPSADLKRRFRDAAKRMHPDLVPDAEARGHAEAFMKRLNGAYRAGDGEAIADLIRQWAASPYGGADGETVTRAVTAQRIAGLAAAVQRAQQRLDEVRHSELAVLMERAMAAAAAGRDLRGELRADAEAAVAAARARLAGLDAT